MRRGIADLYRRTEVSQAANNRYIEAIAAAAPTTPMRQLVAGILRHTKLNGYRVRAPDIPESSHIKLTNFGT